MCIEYSSGCFITCLAFHLMSVLDYQGAPPCIHYAQRGVCKFGPSCKFDHPVEALPYSPSASSFVNVPVVSIPAGLSVNTFPPSSSSSELRPELSPGSSEEHGSSKMSLSMSTSTESVALTGTVSQSNTQTSTQSSVPVVTSTITTSSPVSHTPSQAMWMHASFLPLFISWFLKGTSLFNGFLK